MTDEQTSAEAAELYARIRFSSSHSANIDAIVRALQAARSEGIDANDIDLVSPHELARQLDSSRSPNIAPLVWVGGRRAAPPGHIVDDAGVVRKLKGEFPITADGVMVQLGEDVWHPESGEALRVGEYEGDADHNKMPLADDCTFCAFFSYYETDTGYSEYEVYDVRQCYSTPEAAEAAKEGQA